MANTRRSKTRHARAPAQSTERWPHGSMFQTTARELFTEAEAGEERGR